MILRRFTELNHLGRIHVKIVVRASVISDRLLLVNKLPDVNAGRPRIFLHEIDELLEILIEAHRAFNSVKERLLLVGCFIQHILTLSLGLCCGLTLFGVGVTVLLGADILITLLNTVT